MSLPAARDLMRCLPDEEQDRLEEQTTTWEIVDVMEAAEVYIHQLESKLEERLDEADLELSDHCEDVICQNYDLEEKYDRAVRVLTNISTTVMNNASVKEDLDFQGDQGSEAREFAHGCYCGRTHFANHLLRILEDNKNV